MSPTVEQLAEVLRDSVLSGPWQDANASLAGDPSLQDWALTALPIIEGWRAKQAPERIAQDTWTRITGEEDGGSPLGAWTSLSGSAREDLVREVSDAVVAFSALDARLAREGALSRVSARPPLAQTLFGARAA